MTELQKSFTTNNGKFSLHKRNGSKKFQSYLKPKNGDWMRLSTGTEDFTEAKEISIEKLIELKVNIENGNPIRTRKFKDVAEITVQDLENKIASGEANTMAGHYVSVIKRLHIPYFGNFNIERITEEKIAEFNDWRQEKYGKKLNVNTIKTHTAGMRLVFKTAIERKWIRDFQVPNIYGEGKKAERRPYFTEDELETIECIWDKKWIAAGETQKIRECRELFKDVFYLISATGIRHGTELYGICWKHIGEHFDGELFTTIKVVQGKKDEVRIVVADKIIDTTIENLRARFPDATPDDLILRTKSGVPYQEIRSLASNEFKVFLIAHDILNDNEGKIRVPYSLRHSYATFKLVHRKLSIYKLSKQMGTSIAMIEKNYAYLEPVMNAAEIAG